MKICLLDVHKRGDNKDYNGGFGTTFHVGTSLSARFLEFIRSKSEQLPLMTYGYYSAVLKDMGHDVILCINKFEHDADIIILHASLIRHNEEVEYLKRIRRSSKAKICVTGPLVSAMPEIFVDLADVIVKGEAENLFRSLKTLADLPEGVVDVGIVEDIDGLPFPDWSVYEYREFSMYPSLKRKPFTFIQGSRSCPFGCNYCPYIILKKSYRIRKYERVVDELEYLKEAYNIRAVFFRDPCFTMHREWLIKLCTEMKDRDIDLEWGCETRSDKLDKELVDLMYESGLRVIKIGVESSSHDVLKVQKRIPPQINHQEQIINYIERRGIKVIAFYILGLPSDTPVTIENTIRYAKKLNTSFVNFTICTPIPGTEFYDEIKERIFDFNLNHYDNFHPVMKLDHLTPDEVKKYQQQALSTYYFRLKFILKFMRNVFRK